MLKYFILYSVIKTNMEIYLKYKENQQKFSKYFNERCIHLSQKVL